MNAHRGMLAVWVGMLLGVLVAGPVRGQARPEPQEPTRPGAPQVTVDFSAAAGPVPARVFGREAVRVILRGKGPQRYTLQWGHKDTVIRQTQGQLDRAGKGHVTLNAPPVRVRTESTLLLLLDGRRAGRPVPVVLFPQRWLDIAAQRIREERVGVIDDRRTVHQALQAEGAEHEVLATQIQRGVFDGGMMVVAGFDEATALRRVCAPLEGRIRHGMTVVLVNPPVGWTGWDAKSIPSAEEESGPVVFAPPFGSLLRPGDISPSAGPVLHLGKAWTSLAWRGKIKPDRDARTGAHRPLIAVRPLAAGHVILAQLPEMSDPHQSPVGRTILNEMILHALRLRAAMRTPGAKETDHVRESHVDGLRGDKPVSGPVRPGSPAARRPGQTRPAARRRDGSRAQL